jgi:hypothetical protein
MVLGERSSIISLANSCFCARDAQLIACFAVALFPPQVDTLWTINCAFSSSTSAVKR